jgi:hypothetical protein
MYDEAEGFEEIGSSRVIGRHRNAMTNFVVEIP